MKYVIVCLLLLLGNNAFAQLREPLVGFTPNECFAYAIKLFTQKDTAFTKLSETLLKPDTRSIYVIKTKHVSKLPEKINGYNIFCVDADSNKKQLYTAQKDSSAVILYMNKMGSYGQRNNTVVMPVRMTRSGFPCKKTEVDYDNKGYRAFFIFENDLNQYRFESTEYFDYTAVAGKTQ